MEYLGFDLGASLYESQVLIYILFTTATEEMNSNDIERVEDDTTRCTFA